MHKPAVRPLLPGTASRTGTLCLLALVVSACSSSSTSTVVAPPPARCAVGAAANTTSFPPDGGSGTIEVTTARECSWVVQSEAPWISLPSDAHGQGDGSIRFSIAANADPANRAAAVSVNDVRMQISQGGRPCEFELSSTDETIAAGGGQLTISVDASHANCSWSAATEVPWISIASGASQTGDGVLVLQIAPASGAPRSGTITVAGQTLTIDQASGCTARPGASAFTVSQSGGRLEVPVVASAGCGWSAHEDESWITIVNGRTGAGSGVVLLDVAATSGPSRSGTVTVAGQSVTIQQGGGCTAAPGASAFTVSQAGGRLEVPVVAPAGCGWSAHEDESWITIVNGHTGAGSGVVLLDVAPTSGPARSGTVTVAGQSVTIQQGGGCTVTTAITTASVGAEGGRLEVPVLAGAGCAWTAQSEAPWISVTSGSSGVGPGTVVLSAAGTEGPLRTGTVNVAGMRVTVTQLSGCRYDVQPSSYAAAAAGAASSITLQTGAGCPWTAASGAGWITVPETSGSGAAPVPFVVAPNDGPQRTGTLTIAGSTITVLQDSPCTWQLAPPSVNYEADGGAGAVVVIVVGGCRWSAASTVDWITIETGHSGTGNGLVQFIVAPNPGPARSGVVRIAGIDLNVRQSGR